MAGTDIVTTDHAFSGSVDLISLERVYGWFMWRGEPSRRAEIVVTADGATLRSGFADLFRADVQLAGIGDGCYGFDFVIAAGEIPPGAGVSVYAVAQPSGALVLVGGRDDVATPDMDGACAADHDDLAFEPLDAANVPSFAELTRAIPSISAQLGRASVGAQVTGVHIDVTDLLIYLSHHRHVSGIQRVQCGYIANMLRLHDGAMAIHFCLQAHGQAGGVPEYFTVPAADIRRLMQEMQAPQIAGGKEWTSYIQKILAPESKPAASFQPDDVLLVMGAPWIFPDYFAAIARAKTLSGVRYFQIFYDLIPTFLPEHCDAGLVESFNQVVAGMLRYADHLFSISQYSAGDFAKLAERCGVALPPMTVIPMGGTVDYNEMAGEREALLAQAPDRTLDRFFKTHQLGEFVLCVGTIESRKNHGYLYQVWKRLTELHGTRTPKLVLVGRLGWHIEPLQRALKMSNWLDGRIVHLPEVSDHVLRELYRRCLFTVFPSIYEGWGLPVGESLYYGKVPVTSGVTSMPEVGMEWAVYVDPFNVEDGLRKIDALLTDRSKLRRAETRIANRYKPQTWHEAAGKFYRQIGALIHAHAGHAQIEPQADDADTAATPAQAGACLQLPECYVLGDIVNRPGMLRAEETVLHQLRVFKLRDMLDGPDWYNVESWGCWVRGSTARLALALDPQAFRPTLCYLSVWLPGWYPATRCTATVNARPAGRFTLPTNGEVGSLRLAIEAADIVDGTVRVEVALERLVPHPDPNGSEPRTIGLGLKSVFLCHKDDFEARLCYLEDRGRI